MKEIETLKIRTDEDVLCPFPLPQSAPTTEPRWEELIELEGSCRECELRQPHRPHVINYYPTVRHGSMERFCLGRSGWLNNGNYLRVEVNHYVMGDEFSPTRATIFVTEYPIP